MSDVIHIRTHRYDLDKEGKVAYGEAVDTTLEAKDVTVHMDASPIEGVVTISILERIEPDHWLERVTLEVRSAEPVVVQAAADSSP